MKISPFLALALCALPACAAPQNSTKIAPKTKAKTAPKAKIAPLIWKTATPAQRAAAATSIRAQLDAFKRDDWAKAATFQSDDLKRNFGSLAQFRAVIETNYPQFADYASIAFDAARARGERVEIMVRLVGRDGVKVSAIYLMRKERGIYRIEGVQGGTTFRQQNPIAPNPADYV